MTRMPGTALIAGFAAAILAGCAPNRGDDGVDRGALAIVVDSLPSGVVPAITVANVEGFDQVVTRSTTLTGLASGIYTVTADDVTLGSNRYLPLAASQSIMVTSGVPATVHVAYALFTPQSTGALTVTILGIPTGLEAQVTVTGPAGFSQSLTATQTLDDLFPGSYTITAVAVTNGGGAYQPLPASQVVSVRGGDTVLAGVTYTLQVLATLSPGFQARSMTLPVSTADSPSGFLTFDYQIYVPIGYTPAKAWPVILEASGTGEFGTNNTAQLGVGLGPHIVALGEQAIVVFPQWRTGTTTANLRTLVHIQSLMNTIAEVNADMTRIYMSGNSGGGFRTWEYLYKYPTLFAAGISAAGGIDPVSTASVQTTVTELRTMPVWIFSADDDTTVPTATYFTPIVDEWAALGIGDPPAKHTLYHAIGGHQPTWDTAFADPATWTWLFAQHK